MPKVSYIYDFLKDKRYGFICAPDRANAIFFHVSNYQGKEPKIGEFVDYDIVPAKEGKDQAINVRALEDTPELRRTWALEKPGQSRFPSEEIRRSLGDAIRKLEEHCSKKSEKAREAADEMEAELLDMALGSEGLVTLGRNNGLRLSRSLDDYERLVKKEGPKSQEVASTRSCLEQEYPHLKWKIHGLTQYAARGFRKGEELEERKAKGLGPSSVSPGADHRIQVLKPSTKWVLFVDESGTSFDRDQYADSPVEDLPVEKGWEMGRFVGILTPSLTPLDPLNSKTHFTDLNIEQRDRIVQHLLDKPVGVFGITVDDLPETRGNRWVDGVANIVGWVLRMLPVDGPTEIQVLVEQRNPYAARDSDWRAVTRVLLGNLTETHPQRYDKIKLSIEIVEKDGSPHLAYADAIAHTWGSPAMDADARLKQSGLLGTCLHQGDGRQLMKNWDVLQRGSRLEGDEWRDLLHDPDAGDPLSVAGILLDQVSESCREDPALWERYFEVTQKYLDSKEVELRKLGKEVAWLAKCKPENSPIPLHLELAWRTAELEEKNHRGCIDEQTVVRLEELGDALYSEKAWLVCQADLDRAVLATNCFQFEEAGKAISRWEGKDLEIPGRLHWGRVQSTLGQHAAFKGDFDQAEEYFAQAINAFDGMVDPKKARGEISQTATYRAIATMDRPDSDKETIRQHVSAVVSLNCDEVREMAGSAKAKCKYPHHLLLRYLVNHGDPEERDAYLGERDLWQASSGHPWPLIQAYRGILLRSRDSDEAANLMVEAYELAMEPGQGPTVHLIGYTIGAIAMAWGSDPLFEKQELLNLIEILPGAEDRINRLHTALEQPVEPPEGLLGEILPFNFR